MVENFEIHKVKKEIEEPWNKMHVDATQVQLDIFKKCDYIIKERERSYGDYKKSFGEIAQFWTTYLDIDIKSYDVAWMMALMKISREQQAHHEDNIIDAICYLNFYYELYKQKQGE